MCSNKALDQVLCDEDRPFCAVGVGCSAKARLNVIMVVVYCTLGGLACIFFAWLAYHC